MKGRSCSRPLRWSLSLPETITRTEVYTRRRRIVGCNSYHQQPLHHHHYYYYREVPLHEATHCQNRFFVSSTIIGPDGTWVDDHSKHHDDSTTTTTSTQKPAHEPPPSVFAATPTTNDSQQQQHDKQFQTIMEQTHKYLLHLEDASNSNDNIQNACRQCANLLTAWEQLQPHLATRQRQQAIPLIQHVYTQFTNLLSILKKRETSSLQLLSSSTSSLQFTSATPFRCLLQIHSSHDHPDGTKALQVLQDWNEHLEGDIEHAPTQADYHAVLQAFVLQTTTTTTEAEASVVAWEILQVLQQDYHTAMRPDTVTYALALLCFRNNITNNNRSNTETLQRFGSIYSKFLSGLKLWMVPSALGDMFSSNTASSRHSALPWILRALTFVLQHEAATVQQQQQHTTNHNTNHTPLQVLHDRLLLWKQVVTLQNFALQESREVGQVIAETTNTILEIFQTLAFVTRRDSRQASQLCHFVDVVIGTLESLDDDSPLVSLPNEQHYTRAIRARKNALGLTDPTQDGHIQKWIAGIEMAVLDHTNSSTEEDHTTRSLDELALSYSELMKVYYDTNQLDRVKQVWEKLANSNSNETAIPVNTFSVAVILKTLARSDDSAIWNDAHQAQAILEYVLEMDPDSSHYFPPTGQHFGSVMLAWERTKSPKGRQMCSDSMDRILHERRAHNPELDITPVQYVALIGSHGWLPEDATPEQVQEEEDSLLRVIDEVVLSPDVTLDRTLCQKIFQALARMNRPDGNARALQLLSNMLELSSLEGRDHLKPTNTFVSFAILQWSLLGSVAGTEQCEKFLKWLEDAFEASRDDKSLRPSCDCYKALMHSYLNANSRNTRAIQAEKVLDRMEVAASNRMADFPNKMLYVEVITAFSESEFPDRARRAEAILTKMAKSFMFGNKRARPDGRICSTLLYTWSKCELPDKAIRAKALLTKMCEAYRNGDVHMQPAPASFVAVLNACAHTDTENAEKQALLLRIAKSTFDGMKAMTGLNETAFRHLLHVIRRHCTETHHRERLARDVFRECCDEGFVSWNILRTVQKVIPSAQIQPKSIDPRWGRNVKVPDARVGNKV